MSFLSNIVEYIGTPARRVAGRRWTIIITVLAWLLLNAPSLLVYPSVSSDEGQFSAVAWNFYTHGSFNSPIFSNIEQGRQTAVYHGRLYAVLLGLHFWLFGVGVMQARLSSLLGALLGGMLAWRVARQLEMSRAACWVASAIFLLSWKTFLAGHRARPDIWMATSCLLMFYLFLRIRDGPTPKGYIILGFICSYLIDIHIPIIYFTAGISLMVVLEFAGKRITWKSVAGYLLGALVGLAIWVSLWLLPNPAQAMSLWLGDQAKSQSAVAVVTSYDLGNQIPQSAEWFRQVFIEGTRLSILEPGLAMAAVIVLVSIRSSTDRMLLKWSGMIAIAFVLAPYKQSWYAVLPMPLVSLIVARMSDAALTVKFRAPGNKARTSAPAALGIFILIVAYIAGDISLTWRSRELSYTTYATALRHLIPSHNNVMAESNWWFVFYDGVFTSELAIRDRWSAHRDTLSPEAATAQIFAERRVGYVLLDERLSSAWQESVSDDEATLHNGYHRFVSSSCTRVGEVTLPYYGLDQGGPALKHTTVWKCR